jgi:hypothetical protein
LVTFDNEIKKCLVEQKLRCTVEIKPQVVNILWTEGTLSSYWRSLVNLGQQVIQVL